MHVTQNWPNLEKRPPFLQFSSKLSEFFLVKDLSNQVLFLLIVSFWIWLGYDTPIVIVVFKVFQGSKKCGLIRNSWLFEVKLITANNYIDSMCPTCTLELSTKIILIPLFIHPQAVCNTQHKQKLVNKVDIFYDTNIAIHTSISIII